MDLADRLGADITDLQPVMMELRRLHQRPEIGLELPETQRAVLGPSTAFRWKPPRRVLQFGDRGPARYRRAERRSADAGSALRPPMQLTVGGERVVRMHLLEHSLGVSAAFEACGRTLSKIAERFQKV